jgi:hypothetical protein
MNPLLVARVHTDDTWAYFHRTERGGLSTKNRRAPASNKTDLDFLLTTSHAACLAASIFRPSSLSRVRRSGKGRCEIKRIAGGRRLLGRIVWRKVVPRGRARERGGSARVEDGYRMEDSLR